MRWADVCVVSPPIRNRLSRFFIFLFSVFIIIFFVELFVFDSVLMFFL